MLSKIKSKAVKKYSLRLLGALFSMLLIGCEEEVKTVSYWDEHTAERKAYLSRCRDGEGSVNPQSCANARNSLNKASSQTFFQRAHEYLDQK